MADPHAPAETPLSKREFVALHMMAAITSGACSIDTVAHLNVGEIVKDAFALADAFLEVGAKGNG